MGPSVASPGPSPSLRRLAGRARRAALQALQVVDPVRLALRPAGAQARIALACVYRADNAAHVRRLITRMPPGSAVRLWSLDGDHPVDLDPMTVGVGPGARFALLNRVIAGIPPSARADGLVLGDDDVRFVVGDVGRLIGTARRARLDLYQPAHASLSHENWPFVRRRALRIVRRTDFVEQGPLLVLSARAQEVLLPLPEDMGMGWGVEVRWWSAARHHGLEQGVVDAVAVRHLQPTARAYDRGAQERQLRAELSRAGLDDLRQLQRTVPRRVRNAGGR